MMKTARVLALALTMFGSMTFAQHGFAAYAGEQSQSQGIVVTDGMIARLKAALRLSAAQEIHWRTLESALRDISQHQVADAMDGGGFVQRVRARMKSYVLDVSAARRVAVAARPLIATLDEDQKRDGMNVVHALGVASLF